MVEVQAILKDSILSQIGNTPLIRLHNVTAGLPKAVEVYAKLESQNPGGSVKDRPALQMILDGLEEGRLRPGKTILDSTSGNTGVALAMIGAVLGYPVKICMPSNVSQERKKRIAAYGAEIIYTDPMEGSDGAIIACREIYEADKEKYFKPDQYQNPSNPKAHELHTAPEIFKQTDGRITHFLATIGTSGTIMGTTRGLKKLNEHIHCVAIEPDNPFHGLEGLKHMESSIVPGIYHPEVYDEKITVDTESGYDMCKLLAEKEGLFVGQSAGAAVAATLSYAQRLQEGVLVTIACDGGERYYSKDLWEMP